MTDMLPPARRRRLASLLAGGRSMVTPAVPRRMLGLGLLIGLSGLGGCAGLDVPGLPGALPPPQMTTVPERSAPTAPPTSSTVSGSVAPAASPAPAPAAPQPVREGPLAPLPELTAPPAQAASAAAAPVQPETGEGAVGPVNDPLEPEQPLQLDTPALHADLWARIRQGFAMPTLDSPLVQEHERWYASRPDYVQRMTSRSARYLYHIVGEVERRRMPMELALLPFIESAFNPTAMSTARASGMWQFIPSTGRDYDLKQNLFRDDRRDVLASTRAALDYLGRLHRMFGDWQLALAAYNWGEGNVKRAIARNERAGLPTDYASLRMPAETRHYVPKLLAVKHIVAAPQDFGLTLPDIQNHPYFVSVPIQRDIDVDLAARLAGLGVDEFRQLNPQHNKPVILAAGTPQVLLPFENADLFVSRLKSHRGPLASWTAWVVPRTMRPAEAARQAGLSEARLREVNRIPPRMLVKAGSALLVPRPAQRATDVSEHVADHAQIALAPDLPPLRKLRVKARKGDTLASVARRYRVSPVQLAQWNEVGTKARLNAGQVLVVYQPKAKVKARTAGKPRGAQVARKAGKPRQGSKVAARAR